MSTRTSSEEFPNYEPLRLSQGGDDLGAESVCNSDMESRILALLDRHRCDTSESGWRQLAITLAFKCEEMAAFLRKAPEDFKRKVPEGFLRGEPGFFMAVRPPSHGWETDQALVRFNMVNAHLPESEKNPFGTWSQESGLEKCSSVQKAAKIVAKVLFTEWEKSKKGRRPPSAARIANAHSEFKSTLDLKPWPEPQVPQTEFLKHTIRRNRILHAMLRASEIVVRYQKKHITPSYECRVFPPDSIFLRQTKFDPPSAAELHADYQRREIERSQYIS